MGIGLDVCMHVWIDSERTWPYAYTLPLYMSLNILLVSICGIDQAGDSKQEEALFSSVRDPQVRQN